MYTASTQACLGIVGFYIYHFTVLLTQTHGKMNQEQVMWVSNKGHVRCYFDITKHRNQTVDKHWRICKQVWNLTFQKQLQMIHSWIQTNRHNGNTVSLQFMLTMFMCEQKQTNSARQGSSRGDDLFIITKNVKIQECNKHISRVRKHNKRKWNVHQKGAPLSSNIKLCHPNINWKAHKINKLLVWGNWLTAYYWTCIILIRFKN